MKTIVVNKKTGKEIKENEWITRKDKKGFYSRYELLEIYESDETARVRFLTGDDGYFYTTRGFHELGLRKVLL